MTKLGVIKERLERLQSSRTMLALGVSVRSGIRFGFQWKLGTLDKPCSFIVLMPSREMLSDLYLLCDIKLPHFIVVAGGAQLGVDKVSVVGGALTQVLSTLKHCQ